MVRPSLDNLVKGFMFCMRELGSKSDRERASSGRDIIIQAHHRINDMVVATKRAKDVGDVVIGYYNNKKYPSLSYDIIEYYEMAIPHSKIIKPERPDENAAIRNLIIIGNKINKIIRKGASEEAKKVFAERTLSALNKAAEYIEQHREFTEELPDINILIQHLNRYVPQDYSQAEKKSNGNIPENIVKQLKADYNVIIRTKGADLIRPCGDRKEMVDTFKILRRSVQCMIYKVDGNYVMTKDPSSII